MGTSTYRPIEWTFYTGFMEKEKMMSLRLKAYIDLYPDVDGLREWLKRLYYLPEDETMEGWSLSETTEADSNSSAQLLGAMISEGWITADSYNDLPYIVRRAKEVGVQFNITLYHHFTANVLNEDLRQFLGIDI